MLQIQHCAQCGGELHIDGTQSVVVCVYCGRRRYVEERERQAMAYATSAAELEREATAALSEAAVAEARAKARTSSLGVGAVAGLPAILAQFALTYAKSELSPLGILLADACVVASAACAALAGGATALIAFQPARLAARVRARLEWLNAETQRRPYGGQCPSCGRAVDANAPSASFACPSCRAPLAFARGVLIAWSSDARARAEAWKWRAFDELLSAELWPWPTWAAFTALLVALASAVGAASDLLDAALR